MLRDVLRSTIPVEMYHFPGEMQDPISRKELEESFGVRLKEVGKRMG